MATTTTSTTTNYWAPLVKTYTGTKDQPDIVTVFFKPNAKEIHFKDEQIINEMGHSPLNFITALPRIEKAAKIIFRELKRGAFFKENSEFWNAFKNLSRGVIQLIPLLGNLILYVHDLARMHFFIHPKIQSSLSNQEGPVVGLAFDGKPIFTVPYAVFQSKFPNAERKPDETTAILAYMWAALKQRFIEDRSQLTTRELAEKMHRMVVGPQFSSSTSQS